MAEQSLTIYYQNVRGLRTKASTFFSNVICSNYSIICITETWLEPKISTKDYFPPCFNVYRQDRDFQKN